MKRRKGLLKYRAPYAKVTSMALETNICSVVFNVRVQELENMNDPNSENYDENESFYFES